MSTTVAVLVLGKWQVTLLPRISTFIIQPEDDDASLQDHYSGPGLRSDPIRIPRAQPIIRCQ